jgi:hypothetical protein
VCGDGVTARIIAVNLTSMLYCLRSKDVCADVIRACVNDAHMADVLVAKVDCVERISKKQTKEEIFTKLDRSVFDPDESFVD